MDNTPRIWRKSSYSGTEQSACFELANLGTTVGIRDSKAPEMGHFAVTKEEFSTLLEKIKSTF